MLLRSVINLQLSPLDTRCSSPQAVPSALLSSPRRSASSPRGFLLFSSPLLLTPKAAVSCGRIVLKRLLSSRRYHHDGESPAENCSLSDPRERSALTMPRVIAITLSLSLSGITLDDVARFPCRCFGSHAAVQRHSPPLLCPQRKLQERCIPLSGSSLHRIMTHGAPATTAAAITRSCNQLDRLRCQRQRQSDTPRRICSSRGPLASPTDWFTPQQQQPPTSPCAPRAHLSLLLRAELSTLSC